MAKLTANTIVAHPKTGVPTVLLEGEEIPTWAKKLVGEHLGGSALVAERDSMPASAEVEELRETVAKQGQMIADLHAALLGGGASEPEHADEAPAGNASREAWAEYAATKGASEDELKDPAEGGLSRDELRAKYGV
jgi:hypothetical protein